jgi:hypothetical protein
MAEVISFLPFTDRVLKLCTPTLVTKRVVADAAEAVARSDNVAAAIRLRFKILIY